ncbi:unnamed protein product [Rotaria sp. Silwood2]|nr:unnamed protein product [Rotaria sp. Silwood2]
MQHQHNGFKIRVLSANAFEKYPMDFTSVLYYLNDQLHVVKTYDLYLLHEIIAKVSGVEVSSTVTSGDQLLYTMGHFFTFLSNVLTTKNFHHKFRSIVDLVLGFHSQVDAIFQISQPLFNLNIQTKFDELQSATSKSSNESALRLLSPVLDFVKTLHPQRIWKGMTSIFNLTFWSLSMCDLQVPEVAYKRLIEELEHETIRIDER